jgi:hypothetical protein
VQEEDGQLVPREKGTPQGGVMRRIMEVEPATRVILIPETADLKAADIGKPVMPYATKAQGRAKISIH